MCFFSQESTITSLFDHSFFVASSLGGVYQRVDATVECEELGREKRDLERRGNGQEESECILLKYISVLIKALKGKYQSDNN